MNIILIGASGSGKTWISNASGVNACMERYRVQYIRLPDLFQEIEEAKMSIPLSEVHAICYRSPHNPLKKSIFFKS